MRLTKRGCQMQSDQSIHLPEENSTEYIMYLEHQMQTVLHQKRYLHTLGVAYLAASLAMCHGASHRKALIAGLLHDCAKELPEHEVLMQCHRLNLPVTSAEEKMPFLLHGIYGAYLAEHQYGVTDPEILNAIRNHTIGRTNMTMIEQIVFLADYLEPERCHSTKPSLDEIRKLAFQNLDEATVVVLENTIRYFSESGQDMDPKTITVLEYYQKK